MKKIRIIQAAILIAFVSILASCSSSYYPYGGLPLLWSLAPGRAFMQQDILMDVFIIATHRDMFTGEVMTTGIILTDPT